MALPRRRILPFLGLLFASRAATAGQNHYLLVKTIDNFQSTDSVQSPSLKSSASATFTLGSPGENAVVSNFGSVNSDTGILLLKASASQSSGTTTVDPKAWIQVTRLEEILKPGSAKPTSVTVKLDWTPAGSLTQSTPGKIDMMAVLRVGNCGITLTRTAVTAGATAVPDQENNDCIGIAGATATAGASLLSVTLTNVGSSLSIETQLSATYSWSGPFVGSLLTDIAAKLSVEPAGTFVGTSPTFLTATPGSLDGGPSGLPADDASTGDASASGSDAGALGGSSDGGGAASGASDDGGCSASTSDHGSFAVAPLAALGAFILRMRRRRRARDGGVLPTR